jgi:hypothetical protein
MKRKYLFLGLAALLAAGGLWFGRKTWRSDQLPISESSTAVESETLGHSLETGQTNGAPARLAPPDQARRFMEFTPEQRVEFARKGHGPGG